MEKLKKVLLVLKRILGWLCVVLLSVEGCFAWMYINMGISIMVKDLPAKDGNWYFNPFGFMCILFPPLLMAVTAWAGQKLTGITAKKYAWIALGAIALGVIVWLMLEFVF